MKLGFIGTGAITEAIVTGLLRTETDVTGIILSERSRAVSARLARESDRVRICADNQEIVDASDLVFLAVLPQQTRSVLSALRFTDGQRICSLVATLTTDMLQGWIDTPVHLFRAIPLPPVAKGRGVTALFPHDELGEAIFAQVGTVVSARTLEEFDAFATASALMGTYFGVLEVAADWLCAQGVERDNAQSYLSGVFNGLAQTTVESGAKSYALLRKEHSTPGGLNEQMYEVFASAGGKTALHDALESVANRVRKARQNTD